MKTLFPLLLIMGCSSQEIINRPASKTKEVVRDTMVLDASEDVKIVDADEEILDAQVVSVANVCPMGMVEVEGDYCFSLVHQCLAWRNETVCLKYTEGYVQCNGGSKHMHFCVDQYEIPNIKGAHPQLGMSFYDVKSFCEAQGKRMGTDLEWTLAAEGNERTPYPHSWERKPDWCNWDKPYIIPNWNKMFGVGQERDEEMARLDKVDPSGSHPNCYTQWKSERVYDMQGNADEWAVNVSEGGKPYIGLLKGGYWSFGQVRNRARPATNGHGPSFNAYEVSGRCFMNVATNDTNANHP